jgi:hypothetical protein
MAKYFKTKDDIFQKFQDIIKAQPLLEIISFFGMF